MRPTFRRHEGFTVIESLIMLVLLFVFSMLLCGAYLKGVAEDRGEADQEWQERGGDEAVERVSGGTSMTARALPRDLPGLERDPVKEPEKSETPPEK